MTVAIRLGLRSGDAATGRRRAVCRRSPWRSSRRCRATTSSRLGVLPRRPIAPGRSQILFTLSIREAGASRTSVAVADRAARRRRDRARLPRRADRVAARRSARSRSSAAGSRSRASATGPTPPARRPAFALGATVLFAVRDNLVRALHAHASPETAAAATLLAGRSSRSPSRGGCRAAGELRGVRAGRGLLRPLLHLSVRGVLPRARLGRLAARGDRVPVGRRPLGARPRRERRDRPRVVGGALLVVVGSVLIGVSR